MRGLPFQATQTEISQFFAPVADVIDIEIDYNAQGRPAGTASVLFASERVARSAMALNKKNMGSRYVELYLEGPAN